jgi:hypothetical protein
MKVRGYSCGNCGNNEARNDTAANRVMPDFLQHGRISLSHSAKQIQPTTASLAERTR